MKARIKRLIINPRALIRIMTKDTVWRVDAGVPESAEIAGFTIDPNTMNLIVFVVDPSFDQVDVTNDVAPLVDLEVRKIQ